MSLQIYWYLSFIFCIFGLTGCTIPANVRLPADFWSQPQHKVAIVSVKPPKPSLYASGNQGLLDYAISSSVNHDFIAYLAKSDLSWYEKFPQNLGQQLSQRKVAVKLYKAQIPNELINYAALAQETASNKVLVIKLKAIGALRYYYGFIPLGPALAYCSLSGELIEPQTRTILWRYQAKVMESVAGEWDQPPNYLNFAKALKEVTEKAQNELLKSLFNEKQ